MILLIIKMMKNVIKYQLHFNIIREKKLLK